MKKSGLCRPAQIAWALAFFILNAAAWAQNADAQDDSQLETAIETLLKQQGNAVITLKNLRGKVELSQDGGRSFSDAVENSTLRAASVVKTSFVSGATIVISKSAVVILEPVSSLTIEGFLKLEDGSEVIQVGLSNGRALISVNNKGKEVDFTARNPVASVKVRGTKFFLDERGVSVEDGLVAFKGEDGRELIVSKGQRAEVSAGGNTTYITGDGNSRVVSPPPPPVNSRPFNPFASPMEPPPFRNSADSPVNWPPDARRRKAPPKDEEK